MQDKDLMPDEADLAALVELKQFLEQEVGPGKINPLKTLTPLTQGLGLESPPYAVAAKEAPSVAAPRKPSAVDRLFTDDVPEMAKQTLKERVAQALPETASAVPEIFVPKFEPAHAAASEPPKLPAPTVVKRLLSWILDQVFVLTIWCVALVVTSNVFSGFTTGFSAKVLEEFGKPEFLRFATLEFATIWLAYLALGIGLMNMTFGMWVWGLRVGFGDTNDENSGMRKVMRVFWSFLFYAPVVPSLFLAVRAKGRNLLDVLSGTSVYQPNRI